MDFLVQYVESKMNNEPDKRIKKALKKTVKSLRKR